MFRDALLKMREVYERSPQMGDASTLEPRLDEVKQSLQKLEDELRRNQVYMTKTRHVPRYTYIADPENTHAVHTLSAYRVHAYECSQELVCVDVSRCMLVCICRHG